MSGKNLAFNIEDSLKYNGKFKNFDTFTRTIFSMEKKTSGLISGNFLGQR